LPRKNLQVLQPSYVCEEHIDPKKLADAIAEHFKAFDLIEGDSEAALALRWEEFRPMSVSPPSPWVSAKDWRKPLRRACPSTS